MVLFTVLVFATGVVLLLLGRSSRDPWLLLHKITFIAWIVVTAIHVLGHMPEILRVLRGARATWRELILESPLPGGAGRRGALGAGVLGGLVLAMALLGRFSAWTR